MILDTVRVHFHDTDTPLTRLRVTIWQLLDSQVCTILVAHGLNSQWKCHLKLNFHAADRSHVCGLGLLIERLMNGPPNIHLSNDLCCPPSKKETEKTTKGSFCTVASPIHIFPRLVLLKCLWGDCVTLFSTKPATCQQWFLRMKPNDQNIQQNAVCIYGQEIALQIAILQYPAMPTLA